MKHALSILAGVGLIAASLATGYWWGTSKTTQVPPTGEAAGSRAAAKGRVLYYRNPMGLADVSPAPKKDSMGMDYIPVYEGEEPQGPEVKISLDKVQKLGVKTEQAGMRTLARTVRAVGTFDVDERAKRTVAPRFEGWIERLYVDATGQLVQRGQPLMDVYSPDLITAQQEYLVAARGVAALKDASPEMQASMRALVEGSIQRLSNWEIGEQELARLRAEGKPRNTMTLRSPASGVVLEKPAVQGMRFMPGETLYRIADLSTLWLLADVFEQDLGLIRPGQAARITVSAFPGKVFEGKVAFIYPTVTPETRTAKLRIEMRNPERLLKPEMYASVELETTQAGAKRLAVADSAVLDSGTRQIVLVRRGEGLFEPREVKLGARGDGYVEVMDGVKAGEEVVVSANFLIDAESNLKAAIAGFGAASPARQAKPAAGAAKTHAAAGTVESVDTKAGSVSISHGPVASLKWPGMTMDFKVRDRALLQTMRAGARINFEFAEPVPGEWTVIGITPAPGAPAAHKGH